MNSLRNVVCTILLTGCFFITALNHFAWSEELVWLRGTFQEVNSASPVVGMATFPLELTRAVIAATPKKFLKEASEDGFHIEAIFKAVEAMPVNEKFKIVNKDIHLEIEKFVTIQETPASSGLLIIGLNSPDRNFNIPVPLALTAAAVPLLQYAMKELKGLEEELGKMLEQVKKTPPGILLKGEDKLMNSWLEIRLQ